jgi:hypothetical protein
MVLAQLRTLTNVFIPFSFIPLLLLQTRWPSIMCDCVCTPGIETT